MRLALGFVAVGLLGAGVIIAQQPGAAPVPLKDVRQKASYAMGANIGRQLRAEGIDLELEVFIRGIREAATGVEPPATEEELNQAVRAMQEQFLAQQQLKDPATKAIMDKNKAEGEAFLAKNKTAQGVQTLPSGLQYKVLKAGNGPSPKATDTVTTHYRGTLLDGSVFDSSYDRGEPTSFPVNRVIRGWTEALQLMKVGDKWQLFIPSELAYGAGGTPGGPIGPHATLVFEVELLGIK